jgi:hypothetical protein
MMDCGWTMTSICSGRMPNRCRASIISSALLNIEALSIEILMPIDQFGWAAAISGVTAAICSRVKSRKGPPEAVRMMRSTAWRWCSSST